MKFIIVFAALFAVALAAPPHTDDVVVLKSESDVGPESFKYAWVSIEINHSKSSVFSTRILTVFNYITVMKPAMVLQLKLKVNWPMAPLLLRDPTIS